MTFLSKLLMVSSALVVISGAPAYAQTSPAPKTVAQLEADLRQQTTVASNARQEVERLRAELALKDELIALGVQRNAELYAIASEIADKGLSKHSLEPFVQAQRVKMENLKQSYEDRLRAARVYDTTLPPSVQARMEQDLAKPKTDGAGSE
ncbi:hypothetical protein OVA03_04540 [Asticcacaulis sp. SL142]|uniref:hypothetical protein n=1 Tax=Asticcacaulis sp. SL142 TaxID=2995155 RepID=UPI00226D196B|nr:hypothetical protein [Asticcacaulis sp. SL142]WAC48359.1 hypothetical protein OVA03_00030 [Asticcacaulis sp. SL142]WAC49188.1 hypothetical protein OVA03_04540 [Asticcacaulis sp. SL142]